MQADSERSYFQKLSSKQKRALLFHKVTEIFFDLKRTLLVSIVLILIIDLIIKVTNPCFGEVKTSLSYIINIASPTLSAIIFIFSYTDCSMKKNCFKGFNLHLLLNLFAGILLGSNILITQIDITLEALRTNRTEAWVNISAHLSESMFIMALFCLVMPIWFLRTIIPGSYCLGVCIAYVKFNYPHLEWVLARNIANFMFFFVFSWVFHRFYLKQFVKNNEIGEWNKVYKDILERNPSGIFVMDTNGKLMYSNAYFNNLVQNNTQEAFLNSIISLKLRDMAVSREEGFSSISPTSFPTEKHFASRSTTLARKKMSTKDTRNTNIFFFATLSSLLEYYRTLLDNGRLDKEDQLIFDGKYSSRGATFMGRTNQTEGEKDKDRIKERQSEKDIFRGSLRVTLSYEVILRPLPEYKKLIVILNDTTERDLIANLENNSEYKDKILASLSHELRTPLNGNLGLLQAAIDEKTVLNCIKNTFLIPAYRAGKILLHVIDDILDYSQSQSQGIILNLENKSLKETFEYCYGLYEHAFQVKNLSLRLCLSDNLPPLFNTDHKRLTQIVLNLLSNALKFTVTGIVTIEAAALDESRVLIQVQDTGLGIEKEHIPKLFEEKVMRKRDIVSKVAGLGLRISHKLAQLLGDDIEEGLNVESDSGKGSCFSFEIVQKMKEEEESSLEMSEILFDKSQDEKDKKLKGPSMIESTITNGTIPQEYLEDETNLQYTSKEHLQIKLMTSKTISQDTQRSDRRFLPEAKKFPKVLIVDDEPFNILVLKSFLIQFGIPFSCAINGKDSLDKITKNPGEYGLILMDCQMPIMDGYEATRALTREMMKGNLPRVPIVGCTAFNGQEKLSECIRCGMEEVITKPVIKEKLRGILKKYLNTEIN